MQKLYPPAILLLPIVLLACCHAVAAGQGELPPGMHRISGKYVDVITDMPLDDALRELPKVFDAAVPHWCAAFDVDIDRVSQWRAQAYVMRSRERFLRTGLLPDNLPQFPYGFQWGNNLWISEQVTDYYHRHLLIHEGTHWFMSRHFGNNGPPWLMEGLAEWYGTHRWDGESLAVGVVPSSKNEVPGWGRISVIQQQLSDGIAPPLETILRYGSTAHRDAEAYAWSWAAVLFLKHHPDSREVFKDLLEQPMRPDQTMTRWFFRRIKTRWPRLRAEWNATITDLEYGFDVAKPMAKLSVSPLALATEQEIAISAQQTWQATGIKVEAGQRLSIRASGEFVVGKTTKPWRCLPDGVTIEYYRGQPLGSLMLTVMSPLEKEPDAANLIDMVKVGSQLDWKATSSGEVFFRVNERSSGLADNSGSLQVRVEPK